MVITLGLAWAASFFKEPKLKQATAKIKQATNEKPARNGVPDGASKGSGRIIMTLRRRQGDRITGLVGDNPDLTIFNGFY